MDATGIPRRTAQDTLTALAELDIDCQFEQNAGERNNAGHYRIRRLGANRSTLDRREPATDQDHTGLSLK